MKKPKMGEAALRQAAPKLLKDSKPRIAARPQVRNLIKSSSQGKVELPMKGDFDFGDRDCWIEAFSQLEGRHE
jgi:hypothetical protein